MTTSASRQDPVDDVRRNGALRKSGRKLALLAVALFAAASGALLYGATTKQGPRDDAKIVEVSVVYYCGSSMRKSIETYVSTTTIGTDRLFDLTKPQELDRFLDPVIAVPIKDAVPELVEKSRTAKTLDLHFSTAGIYAGKRPNGYDAIQIEATRVVYVGRAGAILGLVTSEGRKMIFCLTYTGDKWLVTTFAAIP